MDADGLSGSLAMVDRDQRGSETVVRGAIVRTPRPTTPGGKAKLVGAKKKKKKDDTNATMRASAPRRPQNAGSAPRSPAGPHVCEPLRGLVASPRRPQSARPLGAETHRQHGNADDVWVVESPEQLRARPPSVPPTAPGTDAPGSVARKRSASALLRSRKMGRHTARPVHQYLVEFVANGGVGAEDANANGNALRATAQCMTMRRRCAGVLAPQPPGAAAVTWRDHKPSQEEVAREVAATRATTESVAERRAQTVRERKRNTPGPAGFGSRASPRKGVVLRHNQRQSPVPPAKALHLIRTERVGARAYLRNSGVATARATEADPFVAARVQRRQHEIAAKDAVTSAIENPSINSNEPGRLRAIHEAALRIGPRWTTVGAFARSAATQIELDKILGVANEHYRVCGEVSRKPPEPQKTPTAPVPTTPDVPVEEEQPKPETAEEWKERLQRVQMTAWVGGFPSAMAQDEEAVLGLISQFGAVDTLLIRVKDGMYKSWALVAFKIEQIDPVDLLMADPVAVPFEPEDEEGSNVGSRRQQPTLKIHRADVAGKLREKLANGEEDGTLAFTAEQMEDQKKKLMKAEVKAGPTAWVGGIPAALAANEAEVRCLFEMFGEIVPGGLKIRQKEGPYKSWCLCEFVNTDPVDHLMAKPLEVEFEPEDEAGQLQEWKRPTLKIKRADVQGELKKKAAKGEPGALAYMASSVAAVAPVAGASGEVVEKLQSNAQQMRREHKLRAVAPASSCPHATDLIVPEEHADDSKTQLAPADGGEEQPAAAEDGKSRSPRGLRRYNLVDVEADVSLKEGLAQQMVSEAAATQMKSPDGSVRSASPDVSLASLNADWDAETNNKSNDTITPLHRNLISRDVY